MADEIQNGSPAAEAAVESAPVVETPANNPTDSQSPKSAPGPIFNREELTKRVEAGLSHLREIDPEPSEEVETPEPKAEVENKEPKAEADAPTEDKPKVEAEAKDEPKAEEEQQPAAEKKPSGPILPDAYRRSLKAYDWTDEEIDAGMAQNPSNFLLTAQKIHANRNKETAGWAEAGRAARAAEAQTQQTEKAKQSQNSYIDPKTGNIRLLDADAMGERYGNPELVKDITGPTNEALALINSILPDLMTAIGVVRQSRTQQLATQIDGFFGQKSLEPFAEHYGKDIQSLTEEQFKTRSNVLEMADALVAGAKAQGRSLPLNDALMMAHDHVSSGLKTATVRKEIANTVQKRATSLTVKPVAGGKTRSGPPQNRSQLESDTRARLAAVFKD
jgi:hypothetical protein